MLDGWHHPKRVFCRGFPLIKGQSGWITVLQATQIWYFGYSRGEKWNFRFFFLSLDSWLYYNSCYWPTLSSDSFQSTRLKNWVPSLERNPRVPVWTSIPLACSYLSLSCNTQKILYCSRFMGKEIDSLQWLHHHSARPVKSDLKSWSACNLTKTNALILAMLRCVSWCCLSFWFQPHQHGYCCSNRVQ